MELGPDSASLRPVDGGQVRLGLVLPSLVDENANFQHLDVDSYRAIRCTLFAKYCVPSPTDC